MVALTLSVVWAADPPNQTAEDRLMALEARSGRRLGVAALDTVTGRRVAHRAGERFAMCSTFKLALAGAVLASVDAGKESLDRRVAYTSADLLSYAPVTREHAKEGSLTVGALCASAVEVSDNTAANLLLRTLGGPAGFTRFLRALGDDVTRLDRDEPTLNTNEPGDVRDTTTPDAMLATMKALLLGDALSPASRQLLEGGWWPAPPAQRACGPVCLPRGAWATRRARGPTAPPTTWPSSGHRGGRPSSLQPIPRAPGAPTTSAARSSPRWR